MQRSEGYPVLKFNLFAMRPIQRVSVCVCVCVCFFIMVLISTLHSIAKIPTQYNYGLDKSNVHTKCVRVYVDICTSLCNLLHIFSSAYTHAHNIIHMYETHERQ